VSAYRQDQGRHVRLAAFWGLAAMLLYGCMSLHRELIALFPSLSRPLGGASIPLLGWDLSPAFLAAAATACGGAWVLHVWLERPRTADTLIETEGELKKVTWPAGHEVLNSSVVVIACVLALMGFLAGADLLLARVLKGLLVG
jgi:preprotein translocase SecE subunit